MIRGNEITGFVDVKNVQLARDESGNQTVLATYA